ncbi:hypothetical protein M2360_004243 [Rhizobium sp. SG_E_25_P2]|uniref:VOC family protein n=1 Tax=Rhizobium sp. SG_E_25_P2 TaxID=2879942 RepID=UPI002473A673|nr:VOC family protein [Rhizobium sp. SG_E_25_P2]MDH6268825.1 hypothetical protein [Rhizobium sp. SG_E_25_P2]
MKQIWNRPICSFYVLQVFSQAWGAAVSKLAVAGTTNCAASGDCEARWRLLCCCAVGAVGGRGGGGFAAIAGGAGRVVVIARARLAGLPALRAAYGGASQTVPRANCFRFFPSDQDPACWGSGKYAKAGTTERLCMRPLDHLVMPVADLAVARSRLSALGFTVAANGLHPFGTENCCVYFSDGAFIEPLAVGDRGAYDDAAVSGNRFVLGDLGFRAMYGEEGLSAVVFGADDAAADHAEFLAAGFSAGDMLDFARPMVFADGCSQIASFRLAFAETGVPGDVFAFTCQRINVPAADRTVLQTHRNGVVGIHEVVLVTDTPDRVRPYLQTLARRAPVALEAGIGGGFAADRISVLSPPAFADIHGLDLHPASSLVGRLIVFAITSLADLRRQFQRTGIDHHMNGTMLIVPPQAGQGLAFAFLEVDA